MKRDNDYLRTMLIDFEGSDDNLLIAPLTMAPTDDARKNYYHAQILCDAGLFEEVNDGVFRMTSQGHDFVETIRDEAIWERTKAAVNTAGGATLSVLGQIAVAYGKQALEEKLGIKL